MTADKGCEFIGHLRHVLAPGAQGVREHNQARNRH